MLGLCVYNLPLVFTKEGWKLEIRQSTVVSKDGFKQSSSVSNNSKISPNPLIFALSLVFFWRSSQPIASAAVESSLLRFCRETHSESLAAHGPLHSFTSSPPQRKGDHLHAFPLVDIFEPLGIFILSQKYWNIRTPVSLWVSRCPRPTTFIHIKPTVCREREITFNKLQLHFNPPQTKRTVFRVFCWSAPLYLGAYNMRPLFSHRGIGGSDDNIKTDAKRGKHQNFKNKTLQRFVSDK